MFTDVSKIIVAINAYKRSLRMVTDRADQLPNDASIDTNGRLTLLHAPRHLVVTDRTVRLLFAFGDYGTRNCEDGYILSKDTAIVVDCLLCCRFTVASKRTTDARVSSNVFFRANMTLRYPPHRGLSLHLGTFDSSQELSFSVNNNLNVEARTRHCGKTTASLRYVYDVFYVNNTSYVQRSYTEECRFASRQRTHVPTRYHSDTNTYEYEQRCGGLCTEYCQPVSAVAVTVHDRTIRVKIQLNRVTQTIKLQNSFGQKGIAYRADLSDLRTDRGEPVDIIASMFSLVGRSACGQLLQQRDDSRRIYSIRTGELLGYGGYGEFFVSDDSPHANFIYSVRREGDNPIRLCRLTYESLLENNVSSASLVKASEFQTRDNNAFNGLPRAIDTALACYRLFDRSVHLRSQRTTTLRRAAYDRLIVRRLQERVEGGCERKRRRVQ